MPNRSAQKQIALRIRSARQAARLTQTELAARLGLSRSAVAQWESATGSMPSTASFAGIAAALACNFEWLATGQGPRTSGRHPASDARSDAPPAVDVRYFARDDDEERLMEAFRALDDFDRIAVIALVETLSARPVRLRRSASAAIRS